MAKSLEFKLPEITDEDIDWASRLLGLPQDAFYGKDGADPRQEVLRSNVSMDVAACPGSGKTTLLVAKLAILVEKWQYRTRGICVLSHTNAARHEIENCLGRISAGRRLLSYPHFIGTIHGFVTEFLAMPWLRSQGYPIKVIDTDICETRRWNKVAHKWRVALNNKHVDLSDIRIIDTSFNWAKKNAKSPFAANTDTYKQVMNAAEATAKEGYHCYDDMFVWAHDIIDNIPEVVNATRDRFPVLFIDEAQDNSEEQSSILHRIFMLGDRRVIRQRFGDENQAIFDSLGSKESSIDRFPEESITKDLPNSHRFGQKIATLADPLAINPCGLKGHGPKRYFASNLSEGAHTILLFADNSFNKVLDNYGEILTETFSDQVLREGTFTAVGQVHRNNGDDHAPRHLGHYWSSYDPILTSRDPKPNTFVQYVLAGTGMSGSSKESFSAVEKIAEGFLRLARMAGTESAPLHHRYYHRHILHLLGNSSARDLYQELIYNFVVHRVALTKEEWANNWSDKARNIAEAIAGSPLSNTESSQFLGWMEEVPQELPGSAQRSRDNLYRYSRDGKCVNIRVGSIHSVKGETHTATLVLETFWRDNKGRHNLELLQEWVTGDKEGASSSSLQQQTRLKIHYVAMTRPTHLLCLAMKQNCFVNPKGELDQRLLQQIEERGWQLRLVT